ncbi:MAG: hypothetical protein CM15mP104_0800 [Gammaproteobacteria bacterium]|nr:MAG: hypothetical protein CM15mP104_0800 [Gammaproteobacteria bacterium]
MTAKTIGVAPPLLISQTVQPTYKIRVGAQNISSRDLGKKYR